MEKLVVKTRRSWRILLVTLVLFSALVTSSSVTTRSAEAASCRFVLGFQTLKEMIPSVVGECRVDVHYNPKNGDALQETTKGLLVWRKADNFTAFTDGYRTWVNGSYGIQTRLNTERFSWESDAAGFRTASTPVTVPTGRPLTGTFIQNNTRDGSGRLTIKNGRDLDALVVLTTLGKSTIAGVYVRAGDSFTITGIQPGNYNLYFKTGEGWDQATSTFVGNARSQRFEDTLEFVSSSTSYSTFEVTLYSVAGGNAATIPVGQGDFPVLR